MPDSLEQLSKRSDSFSQVIKYLEEAYQSAQRTGGDKVAVELEAKEYVAQGLAAVLGDIEAAAVTLDKTVDAHGTAIDSISSQVQLIQFRLQSMKQQQQLLSLEAIKQPTRARVPDRVMQEDSTVFDVGNAAAGDVRGRGGEESKQSSSATKARPSFEQRLSRLESVGVSSHPWGSPAPAATEATVES